MIDRVQLRPVVNKLPHGLDNFLGAKGGRLSGGERQRVSIARGVLANRPFMFMDEPTSAQDAAVRLEQGRPCLSLFVLFILSQTSCIQLVRFYCVA